MGARVRVCARVCVRAFVLECTHVPVYFVCLFVCLIRVLFIVLSFGHITFITSNVLIYSDSSLCIPS